MDITALPDDLFLLVLDYLSPSELIACRAICKSWQKAFTDPDRSRRWLQQHYPRVRELRHFSQGEAQNWSQVLATVCRRYHYLKAGRPRKTVALALKKSLMVPEWARHYPVATWQRQLSYEAKTASFHYLDPLWTYDDGLLVFPSAELQRYVAYDLTASTFGDVALQSDTKIVRRIRLKERVLVVEWCESEPYHRLNENEMVHRHFATAYDLVLDQEKNRWNARFRNEWKIHFLGLPLNSSDRFFTAHTATHWAMYLWQPNRSAWGEDDPIERLAIWDISSPSAYRPSEDITGSLKPDDDLKGPRVIRRLSFSDLDFYRIRQRSTPTLRELELDEKNLYFIQEDHRWLVGQQAGHSLPRLHMVKTVGIPFADGPRWEDECGANGDVNLSFCERNTDERCPHHAPCWRHEEFPYLTITEAYDVQAGVRFCARHCFLLETISINIKPHVRMSGPGYDVSLKDDLWQQLLAKGKICGDERWLIGENFNNEVQILYF
ncbi:hypothetical protein F5884DRAFT_746687 [Xylogone sp. PMI_703]|nr:hypothetical protein F5884DRAFT_746687 [Xylogone sp. PMI_703]